MYIYGLDPAQTLNFAGIVVTTIENRKIRIATVRKFQKLTYPELEEKLFDLFERYPPRLIISDYTSEKSFSETLEAKFHPSFMDESSPRYKEWRKVRPVVFTPESKLKMKQNAREIMEKKQLAFPNPLKTDPRMWLLIEELKGQMMREAASAGRNGLLLFPKPEGHDNDLVTALELSLYGAKEFLYYNRADYEIQRQGRHNPMAEHACIPCKQNNHVRTIHQIYWDPTGGQIDCPCPICNGTESP